MSMFDMHGDATDRITMRTSNALPSADPVNAGCRLTGTYGLICASIGWPALIGQPSRSTDSVRMSGSGVLGPSGNVIALRRPGTRQLLPGG